jgi:hypothetical protein
MKGEAPIGEDSQGYVLGFSRPSLRRLCRSKRGWIRLSAFAVKTGWGQ